MSFEYLLFIIAIFFIFALLLVVVAPNFGRRKKLGERVAKMAMGVQLKAQVANNRQTEKQRIKMRETSLKLVDETREKSRAATNPGLMLRLHQADMKISVQNYWVVCLFLAMVSFLFGLVVFALPFYLLPLVAGFFGFWLPNYIVNFRRARRYKKFTLAFPNAVDVIVRGVRSGLPLNDCLLIIANDSDEPLKSEFKKMLDGLQLGLTMPEVCGRLYRNIATPEVNFFAVVISIQSQAGGNLSEALENLSNVLRERQKVADKIKALSMEAKASAYIIGALPFIVSALLTVVSPTHLLPLFITDTGNIILYFAGGLMLFGILIMKRMINFKY